MIHFDDEIIDYTIGLQFLNSSLDTLCNQPLRIIEAECLIGLWQPPKVR
jgi:hypothetical protein